MTSEDLAELLAAYVGQLADKPINFSVKAVSTIAEATAEKSDWTLFFVPFDESEEAIDGADHCREDLKVRGVLNGPLKQITRKRGLEASKWIRQSLKQTGFQLEGDDEPVFDWDTNEVETLWDTAAAKERNQFLSLFNATYYAFA